MTRYILIDSNAGFIWGDARAETPAEACRLVDEGIGEFGRVYTEHGPGRPFTTGNGYHVYAAPADFPEIEDGQSRAEIEAVLALPCVAFVAVEQPGGKMHWTTPTPDVLVVLGIKESETEPPLYTRAACDVTWVDWPAAAASRDAP